MPPLPQLHRLTCTHCGFGWDKASAFCPRCGAAQTEEARRDASPVKAVYGCCALFFGVFGAACVPPLLPAADSHQTLTLAFVWALTMGILTLICIWKFFHGGN